MHSPDPAEQFQNETPCGNHVGCRHNDTVQLCCQNLPDNEFPYLTLASDWSPPLPLDITANGPVSSFPSPCPSVCQGTGC